MPSFSTKFQICQKKPVITSICRLGVGIIESTGIYNFILLTDWHPGCCDYADECHKTL